LIVDLSAPARAGRESFCAPSNKESAVPSLLSNLIGLRKRCRLHFSPLLEALACGKLLPSGRKPIILHGTIAIRNPPAADSTEIAPCWGLTTVLLPLVDAYCRHGLLHGAIERSPCERASVPCSYICSRCGRYSSNSTVLPCLPFATDRSCRTCSPMPPEGRGLPTCDRWPRLCLAGTTIAWACAHVTAAQHVLYSTRGRASHTTAIMRLRPRLAPWTWSAA